MFLSVWSAILGLIVGSVTATANLPVVNTPLNPSSTSLPLPVPTQSESTTAISTITLSKCLSTKGYTMYGAFWCPHCSDQKKSFGEAFQNIKYIECDPKGPQGNPQACKKAAIEAYPTWVSPSGEKKVGAVSLPDLATWSKCKL